MQEAFHHADVDGLTVRWTSASSQPTAHVGALTCETCGKSYKYSGHLANHRRSCGDDTTSLLEQAKSLWEQRKRRRAILEVPEVTLQAGPETLEQHPSRDIHPITVVAASGLAQDDDLDLSLAERKGKRQRRAPARFRDYVPSELCIFDPQVDKESPPACSPSNVHVSTPVGIQAAPRSQGLCRTRDTSTNSFGLKRRYYVKDNQCLVFDSDQRLSTNDIGDFEPEFPSNTTPSTLSESLTPPETDATQVAMVKTPSAYGPFSTLSSFELGDWYLNSTTTKSFPDFQRLLAIMSHPSFRLEDVTSENWGKVLSNLGANKALLDEDAGSWIDDDGWKVTDITFKVPFHSKTAQPGNAEYGAGKLHHRDILDILRETVTDPVQGPLFQYQPYQLIWERPPTSAGPPIEVDTFGELYSSKSFVEAHHALQNSPSEPGCDLERVVAGLMFWSDETHLTDFGSASLWPCYLGFGNDSKYRRATASRGVLHHLAYFEKISDSFKDFFKGRTNGNTPGSDFIAHCNRVMLHEQWAIILDDDLLHAMVHGVVIKCWDGISRRFYPRIFTYSADYPEKIKLATLRGSNSACPCPRCLIPHGSIGDLGTAADRETRSRKRVDDADRQLLVDCALDMIYIQGRTIDTKKVDEILQPTSLTPVTNAFSRVQRVIGFNIFNALVVDLLHEFEIGIWKNLFIHLLRLLESFDVQKGSRIKAIVDSRYRMTPTFGRGVIRKFNSNASELSRMTARDYEDLLQCASPVFDGVFPAPHNEIVMKLIHLCAEWHALAKLRLHNNYTLGKLELLTSQLADQFRIFLRETCQVVETFELQKEADARHRREAKKQAEKNGANAADRPVPVTSRAGPFVVTKKAKAYNPGGTYKFHAVGDYADTIREFGSTDSYTTEIGEFAHRDPKSWFKQTDKRNFRPQLASIDRKRSRLTRINSKLSAEGGSGRFATQHRETKRTPRAPRAPIDQHIYIGATQNRGHNITTTFSPRMELVGNDPSLKSWIAKLKVHLAKRLRQSPYNTNGGPEDWLRVHIHNDRVYDHRLMNVRYTSYDIRRDEDIIHIGTSQCSIMTIDPDFSPYATGTHPFRYCKVLAIFHTNAELLTPSLGGGREAHGPQRVEFLWVRWYRLLPNSTDASLDELDFPPMESPGAFDFIDPSEAIRAAHIIPRFAHGSVHELESCGRSSWAKDKHDWKRYYVNKFVDRDMYMRYQWGMAIGHKYTHDFIPPIPTLPPSGTTKVTQALPAQALDVAVNEVPVGLDEDEEDERFGLEGRDDDEEQDEPDRGLDGEDLDNFQEMYF